MLFHSCQTVLSPAFFAALLSCLLDTTLLHMLMVNTAAHGHPIFKTIFKTTFQFFSFQGDKQFPKEQVDV